MNLTQTQKVIVAGKIARQWKWLKDAKNQKVNGAIITRP